MGPSVITHPSLSLLWQGATTAVRLNNGDTIRKNPVGLLEKDVESLMETFCLLDWFKLLEPDGPIKLNLVKGEKR